MPKIFNHPTVRKVVNKKTILWFTIFKLVTYIIIGGFFAANTMEAKAARQANQVKIATESRVYYIDYAAGRKKAYNSEKVFASYGQRFSNVAIVSPDQLNVWPEAKLIKQKKTKTIYFISNGQKCAISGPSQLKKFKLDKEPVLTVNIIDLNSYKNKPCAEILAPIGGSDSYRDYYTSKYTDETATDYVYTEVKMYGQTNGSYAPSTKNNILGTFVVSNDGSETILLKNVTILTTNQDIKYSHGFSNLAIGLANTKKKLGYTNYPAEEKNTITLGRYELPAHQAVMLNITVDTLSYVPIGNVNNSLAKLQFEVKKTRKAGSIEGSKNVTIEAVGQLNSASGGTAETLEQAPVFVNPPSMQEEVVEEPKNTTPVKPAPTTNSSKFAWPTTSKVVNYYFADPTYPYRNEFQHNGLDIDAHQGSSVFAADAGTVVQVINNNDASFNYVRIRHENGLETGYGHLSRIDVTVGQEVTKGIKIGLSGGNPGTTGAGSYSTGAHLHFEVVKNGEFVDPMIYMK